MKIMVDIDEETYGHIQKGHIKRDSTVTKAVLNGILLDDIKDKLEKEIDDAFDTHSEWATGVYYALGEIGLIDEWVKQER